MQRQDLDVCGGCLLVCFEGDAVAHVLQSLFAVFSKVIEHQRIAVAVTHENWGVLVDIALRNIFFKLLVEQEPRREADNAANLDWSSKASKYAHGTALGESTEDDTVSRNTILDLLLNEPVEVVPGLENAGTIFIFALLQGFLSLG